MRAKLPNPTRNTKECPTVKNNNTKQASKFICSSSDRVKLLHTSVSSKLIKPAEKSLSNLRTYTDSNKNVLNRVSSLKPFTKINPEFYTERTNPIFDKELNRISSAAKLFEKPVHTRSGSNSRNYHSVTICLVKD